MCIYIYIYGHLRAAGPGALHPLAAERAQQVDGLFFSFVVLLAMSMCCFVYV